MNNTNIDVNPDDSTYTEEDAQAHDQFMKEVRQKSYISMKATEKLELATKLQKYHGVFKKFFEISTIVFTNTIPTAAVQGNADTDRVAMMLINSEFWASLSDVQKLWIICHECLHAILNHFSRGKGLDHRIANRAMDIVVNHTTVEKFGFKRSEIDPEGKFCWIDTIFKPEMNIASGQSFEYYYQKMLEHADEINMASLADSHDAMTEEEFREFIKRMNKQLTPEEKKSLQDWLRQQGALGNGKVGDTAGDEGGGTIWTFEEVKNVKKKKKWESVIKNWVLRTVGMKEKALDQWVHEDRRLALLPKSLSLPYARDVDEKNKKKDKIALFFFLDTSGSCISFGERFFRAAKTIPTDKFDIYLFNFDTSVYEVSLDKSEVIGGGGTRFDIIEDKIQEIMQEKNIAYPKAVWLITDGEGNSVTPEVPENWHWFMTDYHSTTYVDEKSHIYKLEDYE